MATENLFVDIKSQRKLNISIQIPSLWVDTHSRFLVFDPELHHFKLSFTNDRSGLLIKVQGPLS
jgi:hypothetical protein